MRTRPDLVGSTRSETPTRHVGDTHVIKVFIHLPVLLQPERDGRLFASLAGEHVGPETLFRTIEMSVAISIDKPARKDQGKSLYLCTCSWGK
jgi:hypothetical protein